jgi:cytoskeletal protein RodZ
MEMTPSVVMAGATLLILYTVTVLGGAMWLTNLVQTTKKEILTEFNVKHAENEQTVKALHTLVIRHDVLLNEEFTRSSRNGANHHG